MAPFFNRPENVIKRAEGIFWLISELIAVNQHTAALDMLHEQIMSKKSRSTPLPILHAIVVKFIELCVELGKAKLAKEALYQFKNIAQNTAVTPIEQVIKLFIESADAKVTEAKADLLNLEGVEDLEELETPESLVLASLAKSQPAKDRREHLVVMPWLRFLWEAYRIALDVVRNNDRLEGIYQNVANHAFKFCLKYSRKSEFRRLCELLRLHLANATKYEHQQHSLKISDTDTLNKLLDTRFVQLHVATELELWQEAFRSVEDIQKLLEMLPEQPKPFMLANYYEKLSRTFLVGENMLFHAAAANKFYNILLLNKNLSEEDRSKYAGQVILAALAIPSGHSFKWKFSDDALDDSRQKTHKLTGLLTSSKNPSRAILLQEAKEKQVFDRASETVRAIYKMLEVDFHPLSICKKVAPFIEKLAKDTFLSKYVKPLQRVILTRLFQQLSQVYSVVKMDFVMKLVQDLTDDSSQFFIERFIISACHRGDLFVKIDHETKSIHFSTPLILSSTEGTEHVPTSIKKRLNRFCTRLYTISKLIDPSCSKSKRLAKIALENSEIENSEALSRGQLIEKKKEIRESELLKREQELARQRQLQIDKELEAERLKMEQDQKRREQERLEQQRLEIEKAEVRKMAEKIIQETKSIKFSIQDLTGMSIEQLRRVQAEAIEKEKRDLEQKLKTITKRQDHFERAYRQEEVPLLESLKGEQHASDLTRYQENKRVAIEAAKLKHQSNMELKNRFSRILPDYSIYYGKLEEQAQLTYKELKKEADEKMQQEKNKRIEQFEKEERLEQERIEQEEREMQQRRDAEDRKRQEFMKMEQERMERDAVKRREAAAAAPAPQPEPLNRSTGDVYRRPGAATSSDGIYRRDGSGDKLASASAPISAASSDGSWRRAAPSTTSDGWRRSGAPIAPASSTNEGWRRSESQQSTTSGGWRRSETQQAPTEANADKADTWRRSDSNSNSTTASNTDASKKYKPPQRSNRW